MSEKSELILRVQPSLWSNLLYTFGRGAPFGRLENYNLDFKKDSSKYMSDGLDINKTIDPRHHTVEVYASAIIS